jgi:hypothetical protein
MLFSPFTSPRRLALIGILTFLVVVAYLSSSSSYRAYLPKYDSSNLKSSNEIDQLSNGRIETPADELTLPVPFEEPEKAGSHSAWHDAEEEYKYTQAASTVAYGAASTTSSLAQQSSLASEKPIEHDVPSGPQPLPHPPYEQVQAQIQELIQPWRPENPQGNHWPPYDDYINSDYNPNRWEGFDFDNDFYVQNGIDNLKEEKGVELEPYLPYPEYTSLEYKRGWVGDHVSCMGPRGKRLNDSSEDIVKAYSALPHGFPKVAIGDADVTGVDISKCFDRYHRYGPYGLGQDDDTKVKDFEAPSSKPDWSRVGWGNLQDQCTLDNKERWAPKARIAVDTAPVKDMPKKFVEQVQESSKPQFHQRTALLIRTWEGYTYTDNDIQSIRALITELSLLSGGEYQVFLFVNIKDNHANLFDEKIRNDLLKQWVPEEFQDISILWNEGIMESWYPEVTDWQVYWHQFMPLQWFMETHPEFDYVWNWETDARFTGNHYQFLEAMAQFSRNAPRKYLWERNQRFYIPDTHGNYSQWLDDTDWAIEKAMKEDGLKPVWGPEPYNTTLQTPIGPEPPRTMAQDNFGWGVGEEADLITLQPIWDPTETEWSYRSKIWNFIPGMHPVFKGDADPEYDETHHKDFKHIKRRTYINTLSRFSRRQLHAMHLENLVGRAMQAEMWPATVALHHGLKAVYAPHPIWTDRKWPGWYMDAIFNADGNETAQWGERADSVYAHDREYNFQGWSWYYASKFPKTLYRRWLGWSDSDDVGPLRAVTGQQLEETGGEWSLDGRLESVGGRGRMCLPAMLLHPVKKVVENE